MTLSVDSAMLTTLLPGSAATATGTGSVAAGGGGDRNETQDPALLAALGEQFAGMLQQALQPPSASAPVSLPTPAIAVATSSNADLPASSANPGDPHLLTDAADGQSITPTPATSTLEGLDAPLASGAAPRSAASHPDGHDIAQNPRLPGGEQQPMSAGAGHTGPTDAGSASLPTDFSSSTGPDSMTTHLGDKALGQPDEPRTPGADTPRATEPVPVSASHLASVPPEALAVATLLQQAGIAPNLTSLSESIESPEATTTFHGATAPLPAATPASSVPLSPVAHPSLSTAMAAEAPNHFEHLLPAALQAQGQTLPSDDASPDPDGGASAHLASQQIGKHTTSPALDAGLGDALLATTRTAASTASANAFPTPQQRLEALSETIDMGLESPTAMAGATETTLAEQPVSASDEPDLAGTTTSPSSLLNSIDPATVLATSTPASASASPTTASQTNLPTWMSPANTPMEQVLEGTQYAVNQGHKELVLKLNPHNLGEVRISLISHGQNEISARLIASNPESLDLLQSQANTLKSSLEAQGIQVERLQVVLAGSAMADGRAADQQHGQAHQSFNPNGQSQASSHNANQQQAEQQAGQGQAFAFGEAPGGGHGKSPFAQQPNHARPVGYGEPQPATDSIRSGPPPPEDPTRVGSGRISILA